MDDFDRASECEEQFRLLATASRRPVPASVALKRKLLAAAHAYVAAGGDLVAFPDAEKLLCENCYERLPIPSDSVFCCSECAADWEARERARARNGA